MFDVLYQGPKPGLFPYEKPATSLDDAARLSRTKFFWYLDGNYDYSGFDFNYHPRPWEEQFIHVWPSQWQQHSNTFLANKYTIVDRQWHAMSDQTVIAKPNLSAWLIPEYIDQNSFDFSWHIDALEKDYVYHFGTQWHSTGGPIYNPNGVDGIKIVDEISASTIESVAEVIYLDHGNNDPGLYKLKQKFPNLRITRFIESYLGSISRILSNTNKKYVWIISSICDYTNFDFSWHPTVWQQDMTHVFASDGKSKGDTFYVNVEVFKQQSKGLELLDWLPSINYCTDQKVNRYPTPIVQFANNLIQVVKDHTFNHPYAVFTTDNGKADLATRDYCVWAQKTRAVVAITENGSTSLIPRDIKTYLTTQIYDYPYINKQRAVKNSNYQDVIFISNGEPMAIDNWNNLKKLCPRAKHSQGITGRELAYKTAANLSETPWFYAVFAKTEVLSDFDFTFQPDYFQEPKHYIFHSRNPLNGLEYGAMNINLYNKQLVLDTKPGLDFTLSAKHAVVPICASISRFNTDPWITWRSAFREVLKLKLEVDTDYRPEIAYRLNVWCSEAKGENAEYCLAGAKDALDYYNQTQGNYEKLKLSFDWAWLQDYYYSLYQTTPWLELT